MPDEAERLRAAIEAALKTLDGGECSFWACDGPDTKPVGMKTCRKCWAVWDLRQALAANVP